MVQILLMQKEEEMAVLIANKLDFRIKKITRDREEDYISIHRSLHQADRCVFPSNRYGKYVKEKLTTERINRKIYYYSYRLHHPLNN